LPPEFPTATVPVSTVSSPTVVSETIKADLPTDAIKSKQSLSDKEARQLSVSGLPDWVESAREIAKEYIDRHKLNDLYPTQNDVCGYVEKEMRIKKISGAHGTPLKAEYIKRNAIQSKWWQENKP